MKKIIIAALLLTACAPQKSPQQIAEEAERRAALERQAQQVRTTKEEPQGCSYVTSIRVQEGWDIDPKDYDYTLLQMKIEAVKHQANTAVLDVIEPLSLHGYRITGRLFNCP